MLCCGLCHTETKKEFQLRRITSEGFTFEILDNILVVTDIATQRVVGRVPAGQYDTMITWTRKEVLVSFS